MKCPHCNFERELPFKFCPMCGVEMVEKVDFCENSAEIQPQPQAVTNVKRIPYGLTEQTYKERKEIKKLSRISAFSFLCLDFFFGVNRFILELVYLIKYNKHQNTNSNYSDRHPKEFFKHILKRKSCIAL